MNTQPTDNNSFTSTNPNANSNPMKTTKTAKASLSRKPARILAGSIAALAALILVPTGADAQLTWDVTSGDGAVITDGTGTWAVGSPNWNNAGVDVNWADANIAVFGGGTSGTAGAVTVSGPVIPTSITFNQPFAGNYTLNGGTISLGAAATDITNNAVGTTTINSNIVLTDGLGGTGTISGSVNLSGRIDLGNGSVGTLTLAVTGGSALAILGAANANNLVFDLASGGTTTDVIAVTNAFNMTTSGAGAGATPPRHPATHTRSASASAWSSVPMQRSCVCSFLSNGRICAPSLTATSASEVHSGQGTHKGMSDGISILTPPRKARLPEFTAVRTAACKDGDAAISAPQRM